LRHVAKYRNILDEILSSNIFLHVNNEYALRFAVARGHIEIVKLLINYRADIHVDDYSALIYAAYFGNIEIVKILIELGADIHVDNEAALRYAAYFGNIEIVKILIELGADIHVDNEGALRWAEEFGHIEIVKLLINHGADKTILGEEYILTTLNNNYLDILHNFYYVNKKLNNYKIHDKHVLDIIFNFVDYNIFNKQINTLY
jgi:ankyrin repeat protein